MEGGLRLVTGIGYILMLGFFAGVLYQSMLQSTFIILVPFAVSVVLVLYLQRPSIKRFVHRRFFLVWILILLTTRLGFFMMYVDYGRVTWDLTDVFYLQGKSVLLGLLPNIGFPTHFNQYLPYLFAVPVAIVDSPYSVVALFIAFDMLVGVAVWKIARLLEIGSDRPSAKEDMPKRAVMLYILCPASFYFTIFWNQQEVVAAFLLLVVLYAYLALRNRPDRLLIIVPLAMAAAFALSYLVICVGLAGVLCLFYEARLKRRIALLFIPTVLALYLPYLLLGVNFDPVLEEFGYGAIGLNPFAVMAAFSLEVGPLPYILLILAYVLVYFAITVARKGYERNGLTVVLLPLLAYLIFMTLSKKSVNFYALTFLPLLAIFVATRERLAHLYVVYGLAISFAGNFADRPNLDELVRLLPLGETAANATVMAFMSVFILMIVIIQLVFVKELLHPYIRNLRTLSLGGLLRFYWGQIRSWASTRGQSEIDEGVGTS